MSATVKFIACQNCGSLIVIHEDGKGTPRRYCDRHCRNEAKKQRRQKKMEPQSK